MPTRADTRNFCRGYPFRSQPEYRKEIRQADGTEPPNPGFPYCAAQWSAVLKLKPGCGVMAILLESPAGGQGVHEVQSPAAVLRAGDAGPQRRHSGTAPVSDMHSGDLAVAEDGP